MPFNYNKLWKLLVDTGMKKKDLKEACQLGPVTLSKLGKNMPVSMDVLQKICKALDCNIGDIVDYIHDSDD